MSPSDPNFQKPAYEQLEQEIENLKEQLKKKQSIHSEGIKYKNIFKYSPIGIITFDIQGNALEVNNRVLSILGSPSIEATKAINVLKFAPLQQIGFTEKFTECVNGQSVVKLENWYTTKHNKIKYIQCIMSPILNEKNKTKQVQCVFHDITDLKTSEQELKKLSTAVEQSWNAVVITDTLGNIEYTNPRFTEMTGYTEAEAKGQNPRVLKSGLHPQSYYKKLWDTISSGNVWKGHFYNKTKHNKYYWEHVTITPLKNENGEIINYVGVKEDITELLQSEERLKTLINASPDAVFFKDGEGRWIETNQAALQLFQLENIEYKGKTDVELGGYTPLYKDALMHCTESDEAAWKNKSISYIEELIHIHDGSVKTFDFVKIPLFYADDTRKGLVIVGRDITQRKKLEQELRSAKDKAEESNLLKAEFLNNISHEIRTPLNAILGFAHFLKKPKLSAQDQKHYINIIDESSNQLLRIIEDILEMSKLATKQSLVHYTKVCVNEILEHLYNSYQNKLTNKQIKFNIYKELSDTDSKILTDEFKLKRILSQLLDNAFKFTNNGQIELGYRLLKNIDQPLIKFFIKDTGIGIHESKQEEIFNWFSKEEKELRKINRGLGLGLSIVKANTSLLGGEIVVESVKGQGSTFYLSIPYRPIET